MSEGGKWSNIKEVTWFPVVLMKDVCVRVRACTCVHALVHSGGGEVVGELCEINWVQIT